MNEEVKLINIAGVMSVQDPGYPYKMPQLIAKVIGSGPKTRTILANVAEIALALKRDAKEVTKFLGIELDAQTTYNDRKAIVYGEHRDYKLQYQLTCYIQCFVLCCKCRLPTTRYEIKDNKISKQCVECGHKEPMNMRHKLCAFILEHFKDEVDV